MTTMSNDRIVRLDPPAGYFSKDHESVDETFCYIKCQFPCIFHLFLFGMWE